MTHRRVRFRRYFAAALASIALAAQGAEDETKPDEPELLELKRIAVTGYSIKRVDTEGPAPVDIYPREEIERSGVNTLGEFFRDLPQSLAPVSEVAQGSGFSGAAYVDLRGIGIDNTLTLLNGKRVAGYARNGASEPFVDVNAIPVAAIERVEILKDGASAIYGADAVAGVVNIILRERFEGLLVDGGYLTTSEGDGEEWSADLVWGWNDDDTSLLATLSWLDKSPVLARDRESTSDVNFSDLGGPDLRAFNSTPSTYFPVGTFQALVDPECGVNPDIADVTVHPFFGPFCAFNYAWFQQQTYDTQRLSANLVLRHEFSNQVGGRLEVFYSERDNLARLAPTPVLGGIIPAEHPNNPYGQAVQLAGRPLDTGDRLFDTTADTYRIVAGLNGTASTWDWSADLLASGNDVSTDRLNAVYSDRYYAALAGTGGPNGDLYYNPFGASPQNDRAVLDWMTTNTQFGADTTENAFEFEASRFFGSLPGGPVGFAAGLQYREQGLDERANAVERSGLLAGGSLITQIDADRNIFAAYGELSLPLHATLEAQVALRYDEYSDFGGTTNPKFGLAWRPNEDWLVRGTWSTSFRPPTFTELFNPPVINAGFFTDVERCETTGAPPDCGQREMAVVTVGNAALQPEEGESIFVGTVWSPGFIEGLDVELDYWRFEHSDRIIELNPQLILDARSNEGVTRAPPTADDIAIGAPGIILQLTQTFQNSDRLETSGFDFNTRYTRQTESAGIFSILLRYTHVHEYTLTEALVGSEQAGVNFAGKYFNRQFGIPEHRAGLNVNWQAGSHGVAASLNYNADYEGPLNVFEDGVFQTDTPWIVDDHLTLDLQYSYLFSQANTELRVGCRNCTDEAPPVTFNAQGDGLYDYRGALFYARLSYRF